MTDLDQQIDQIRSLSERQYPESAEKQQAYMLTLLLQRLREFHARIVKLEAQ